jgi:hypothetical protein
MMRELLLESQLPTDVISKLMSVYVPKKHHHAIKPIVEATPSPPQPHVFHLFPSLPAELRITIWQLAAAQPRRVLRWTDDKRCHGGAPLNAPTHKPLVAQACKEAWDVVNAMGSYCEPQYAAYHNFSLCPWSDPFDECTWAAAHDLVFIPADIAYEPRFFPRARGFDFLCARNKVAVAYQDFASLGASRRVYKFLAHASKLDTLVCVMAEKVMNVCVVGEDVTDLPAEHVPTGELLRKLVMYEDLDELERLDALWRGVGPPGVRWICHGAGDLLRVNAAVYADTMVSRCVECEMRRWESECVPRIRSVWLRMVWAEDLDMVRGNDPAARFVDVFPDGFTPDEAHPWVRREMARMPVLKPAVLLSFVRRQVADDSAGSLRYWSDLEYLLEHPRVKMATMITRCYD